MMNQLHCRVCMDGIAEPIGEIPDCGEFAGQLISPPIQGGMLLDCRDCGSMFRYPTLHSADYIALYKNSPSTVWEPEEIERNDFSKIYAYLREHVGGEILDIGCYAGDFLAGLPDKFVKYGVEPSKAASESASSKGINILADTLDGVESGKVFEIIVSIDVIEHILDVEEFLSLALAHVKENGLLIISTGNPDSFFWKKIFKSEYWYNYYPEHVTFPSYRYYSKFSKHHSCQPPEQIHFKYENLKFHSLISTLFRFTLRYVLLKIIRTIYKATSYCSAYKSSVIGISLSGVFTDHHIIIFRKKGKD